MIQTRGFARILELVLVLVLLFALVTTVTQQIPPTPSTPENLEVLARYASDIRNMVCNSDRDRKLILSNSSLDTIEDAINYVAPADLNFRIVILDPASGSVIATLGDSLPTGVSIVTSSCILTRGNIVRKVVVQTWH